jgi:hypothetical protein
MLPDPRWDAELPADLFTPSPCIGIESIARKDEDTEVITEGLAADTFLPWLDGRVSQHRLRSG